VLSFPGFLRLLCIFKLRSDSPGVGISRGTTARTFGLCCLSYELWNWPNKQFFYRLKYNEVSVVLTKCLKRFVLVATLISCRSPGGDADLSAVVAPEQFARAMDAVKET